MASGCEMPVAPPPKAPRVEGIDLESRVAYEDSESFWMPQLTCQQKACCEYVIGIFKNKLSIPGLLDKEFHHLKINRPPQYELTKRTKAAVTSVNQGKNRYMDVLPFDDTRVILQASKGSGSDYINANFVEDASNKLPRFIAAQGPLKSTAIDFWEMVMQQRCSVIIMITNFIEGNMEKCAPYFPTTVNQSQVYGRLKVTNRSCSYSHYSIAKRVLEIQAIEKSYELPLNVLHMEYLHWPDHGVPASTRSIRELFRCLSSLPHDIPHDTFIVHCSAGIGRSGTYMTIDHTVRRILMGDMSAVDVEATVRNFRHQRSGMVQTKEQYHFIYMALIDEIQDLLECNN